MIMPREKNEQSRGYIWIKDLYFSSQFPAMSWVTNAINTQELQDGLIDQSIEYPVIIIN